MPNVLPAGPVLSHDPGNPLGTLAELFDVNWYLAHTDDPPPAEIRWDTIFWPARRKD